MIHFFRLSSTPLFSLVMLTFLLIVVPGFALSPDDDPEIRSLHAEADRHHVAFKTSVAEVERLKADFQTTKSQHDRVAAELATMTTQRTQLVNQGNLINAAVKKHKDEYERLMTLATQYKNQGNQAEAKRYYDLAQKEKANGQAKQQQLTQLKSQVDALETRMTAKKREVDQLAAMLTTKKNGVEQAIARTRDLEQRFKQAVARYESARNSLGQEMQNVHRIGLDRGKNEGLAAGKNAGIQDGTREGRIEGERQGRLDGITEGKEREHRRGYNEGVIEGEARGRKEGLANGSRDGEREGRVKGSWQRGYADGHAQGLEEGYASDAEQRGREKGEEVGRRDGTAQGQAQGAIQGKHDTTAEFEKGPLAETTLEQQIGPVSANASSMIKNSRNSLTNSAGNLPASVATACSYSREVLRRSCIEGFEVAFHQARQDAYKHYFEEAFAQGRKEAYRTAFEMHAAQQYPESYREGLTQGREQGYSEAYQPAYQRSKTDAFEHFRKLAYENKDQQDPASYEQGRVKGQAEGYAKATKELFDRGYAATYEPSRRAAYEEAYRTHYERTKQEVVAYYQSNPVLAVAEPELLDQGRDGVLQPGEVFDVRLSLRNSGFASSGATVQLSLRLQGEAAVVHKDSVVLVAVPPRTVAMVTLRSVGRALAEELLNNATVDFALEIGITGPGGGLKNTSLHQVIAWPLVFTSATFDGDILVGQETGLTFQLTNASSAKAEPSVELLPRVEFLLPVKAKVELGTLEPKKAASAGLSFKVQAEGLFKQATVELEARRGESLAGAVSLKGSVSTKYVHNASSQLLLLINGLGEETRRISTALKRAGLSADIYDMAIEGRPSPEVLAAYTERMVLLVLAGQEQGELLQHGTLYANYLARGGKLLVSNVEAESLAAKEGFGAMLRSEQTWNYKLKDQDKQRDLPFLYASSLLGKDKLEVAKAISGNFYNRSAFRYRVLMLRESLLGLDDDTLAETFAQAQLWLSDFSEKLARLQSPATRGALRQVLKKAIVADVIEEMAFTEAISDDPYRGAAAEGTLVQLFAKGLYQWGLQNKEAVEDIKEMYHEADEYRKTVSGGLFHSKKRNISAIIDCLVTLF